MEINNLLDQCMERLGIKTDYQLAKRMVINNGRISDYRKGNRLPDTYACFKIAEILDMDRDLLIAHFEGLAAKNPVQKEFWEKYYKRLGGYAAGFILGYVTLFVTSGIPATAEAAPLQGWQGNADSHLSTNIHYAK